MATPTDDFGRLIVAIIDRIRQALPLLGPTVVVKEFDKRLDALDRAEEYMVEIIEEINMARAMLLEENTK